jgi:chromate reductase
MFFHMEKIQIGVIVGSLRKASFCRKVAVLVSGMMDDKFEMVPVEIGDLVMFNQDYDDEGKILETWERFRSRIKSLDAFLFVTPEYNRSIPPVLKNALDIASRPYGKNVWDGKPGAVIGVSPGKMGAFGAVHALRQAIVFLNVMLMQQPEAYIGGIASLIDADGKITDVSFEGFIRQYAAAFGKWVEKIRGNG